MKTKLLILILLFVSCDVQKRNIKNKEDITEQKEVTTSNRKITEETRKGGNLVTDIIPENKRERDENGDIKELIQEIKDGGLTKTIYYKPDGAVTVQSNCEEILRRTEELNNENVKTFTEILAKFKDSEKEENFDSSFVLYIVLGLVVVLIVALFIAGFIINKHFKKITDRL